jgi:ribosome-binding protein aMBF1 (putative translation factor)
VKLSELPTLQAVVDRQREDPEFRGEWDRTVFAREVANRIVRYRADHGMTQTQLAQAVGMKQPVIARLERGEQPPSLATLARVTAGTGIEFHLDVRDGAVALTA